MSRVSNKAGVLVLACAGVLGVTAFGGVVMGVNAQRGAAPAAEGPSAAEAIATRFPSINAAPSSQFGTRVAGLPIADPTLFSPLPSYPVITASLDPSAGLPSAGVPAPEPEVLAPAPTVTAKADAPLPKPRRAPSRPSGVLNDAQIASLKHRLNLSPDQERLWPAVEGALRKIVYAKTPTRIPQSASGPSAGMMSYVDADSAEVQELKYAALPLIMRLNDDQKREVRSMAHVMGLENVASQF
jgi:hypothetical protein